MIGSMASALSFVFNGMMGAFSSSLGAARQILPGGNTYRVGMSKQKLSDELDSEKYASTSGSEEQMTVKPKKVALRRTSAAFGSASCKRVLFIRHGHASHNRSLDFNNEKELDARLTSKGHEQIRQAREKYGSLLNSTELLVMSPLSRALQTGSLLFNLPDNSVPCVALEVCREELSTHQCDRRRGLEEIRKDFDHVDFSVVSEFWPDESVAKESSEHADTVWNTHFDRKAYDKRLKKKVFGTLRKGRVVVWKTWVEPTEELEARGDALLNWIWNRPETDIAVVSHANFLYALFNRQARDLRSSTAPEYADARAMSKSWSNCEVRCMYVGEI